MRIHLRWISESRVHMRRMRSRARPTAMCSRRRWPPSRAPQIKDNVPELFELVSNLIMQKWVPAIEAKGALVK